MIGVDLDDVPVTLDGVTYKAKELPPMAQQTLRQVLDLRRQRSELAFKLEQVDVAEHSFSSALDEIIREWAKNGDKKAANS